MLIVFYISISPQCQLKSQAQNFLANSNLTNLFWSDIVIQEENIRQTKRTFCCQDFSCTEKSVIFFIPNFTAQRSNYEAPGMEKHHPGGSGWILLLKLTIYLHILQILCKQFHHPRPNRGVQYMNGLRFLWSKQLICGKAFEIKRRGGEQNVRIQKWHLQRDSNPCCRDENPVS